MIFLPSLTRYFLADISALSWELEHKTTRVVMQEITRTR